ncbi:MAG: hypothetical protein IPP18_09120 [Rhodocyclaceae bacterium]|jgi:predicted small lipoprotein YifL|nr:hypothetical protein [Rhodocyclaceae bacterium]MBK6555082.1 hypothetical protein [Rhodocyclaceae bacterium]MBK9309637.1 hypothetical protein [Rhodocyclaceae bacterium]MBK9955275.1 hypothetical protein [Rhodocyclaceae bacterium]
MHPVPVLVSLLAIVAVGAAGCGTKGPLTLPTSKPAASVPDARLAPPGDGSSTIGGVGQ